MHLMTHQFGLNSVTRKKTVMAEQSNGKGGQFLHSADSEGQDHGRVQACKLTTVRIGVGAEPKASLWTAGESIPA